MIRPRSALAASFGFAFLLAAGCQIAINPLAGPGGTGATPVPDGIDPINPSIERSTKTVDFDAVGTLRIDVPTGRVVVKQGENGAAALKVTKTVLSKGHTADQMRKMLTESIVTIETSFVDAARLEITAEPDQGLGSTDIAFDLTLTIPRGVPMQIVLGNGPVDVTGVAGNIEIQTANGAITVKDVTGHVVARTDQRGIEIVNVTGNVEAVTNEADITIRAALGERGLLSARTTGGNVSLSVPKATMASMRLDATDGTISANLTGFTVTDLSTASDFLRGVLNGGGGQIEARTSGGQVLFTGI